MKKGYADVPTLRAMEGLFLEYFGYDYDTPHGTQPEVGDDYNSSYMIPGSHGSGKQKPPVYSSNKTGSVRRAL